MLLEGIALRLQAVEGVGLDVPAGQTLAVTGPGGCGKSALLRVLGGLGRPTEGEVWLGGRRFDHLGERAPARLRRRAVGFVFQAYHLMHELSAAQNVELPALLTGASPRTARRRAAELLDQVGLADRARHLPSELSGGQRQRVAIARALVNKPLVVLADEPTGNLDSAATRDVLRLFDGLRTAGQTLVMVTHDEGVAATADRIVSLRDGVLDARTSLVHALADPAHMLTHHPRLNAATAYLPTSLLLGIRLLARRPGRAVLTFAGAAATTLMVTAVLTFHAEQLLPAVPGVAAGVPAGLGLYWLFGAQVMPPGSWLLTAALVIPLAVGALTALPAWAHTRSPAGRALDAEPA
ncbi:ABC transporter ATP-binding protein [Streptomyces sparsogenes]|uniref:ABC transporter ATP-binding protein n=1 Tax=Streptomyces sparsogenes TaxID=67365 RepID=UPI00332821D3